MNQDRRLRTVRDVALELGIPEKRVYEAIEQGSAPHRRLGRRVYFTRDDLDAFLERLARPGRAEACDA
jgi:excisionase family DNA binding protein